MIRNVHSNFRISIGDAISARDMKLIYDHEFEAVLDLAGNEPPAVLGRDIIYCRFPLSDDGSNSEACVSAAVVCLRSLVEREFKTLVACSAAMSRSPLIAAATIALISGDSLSDCLSGVLENAPHDVSPTLYASVRRVLTGMDN